MILINTKTILACNEKEEDIHNEEIIHFFDKLLVLENFRCGAVFQRIDSLNSKPLIKECLLHDCLEMIEYVDFKNGVDLCEEDECITFYTYGNGYCSNEEFFYVTNKIKIIPYDKNGEPINVFRYLDKK